MLVFSQALMLRLARYTSQRSARRLDLEVGRKGFRLGFA